MADSIIQVNNLCKRYRRDAPQAVDNVSFTVPKGQIFGLIGPDGAGKTSTIQMLTGVVKADSGSAYVSDVDVVQDPESVKGMIGYMPQGLGQNLYNTLSIGENIEFFRALRQVPEAQFHENRDKLLQATHLAPFIDRPAGKLSGGMRQKLALICTLLHFPDIILLDEPTTGVDPISRRDFWAIIHELITERAVTVLLTTSYMDEAERCQTVALMSAGKIIASGPPAELTKILAGKVFELTGRPVQELMAIEAWEGCETAAIFGATVHVDVKEGYNVEEYVQKENWTNVVVSPIEPALEDVFVHHLVAGQKKTSFLEDLGALLTNASSSNHPVVVENLTCRFGDFVAVDHVSFALEPGEIFGLLGPNGAGKTTLIKMLCGLLEPTEGKASVVDCDIVHDRWTLRAKVGYMSQRFSLYQDLKVIENLHLYGGLYGLTFQQMDRRINLLLDTLGLAPYKNELTGSLPMGLRQRISLGCSLLHEPSLVFLDEPTSGVDPIARREFWDLVHTLATAGGITILVSTHYMDEAQHCNRLGLMQDGKLIALDSPNALIEQAQQGAGPLLICETPQFAEAFHVLYEHFPKAMLYGRRIQWQTLTPKEDEAKAKAILEKAGIHTFRMGARPLTMEEAFVYYMNL